jgi:hypothetical protein
MEGRIYISAGDPFGSGGYPGLDDFEQDFQVGYLGSRQVNLGMIF